MNAVLRLGKFLFAIPFAIFGLFHFMGAEAMKGMAFGSSILVYFTGLALIAAAVSILIGKMDKLATALLGLMLLLFIFIIHLNGAMAGDQAATMGLLKDLALAGAAWMYAGNMAKDNAIIG
ncbi:MAG: hypothetical protein MI974_29810 [Chitinophagales bacterium]|nr:hypothetical protein [Chitinophagales bacterium]